MTIRVKKYGVVIDVDSKITFIDFRKISNITYEPGGISINPLKFYADGGFLFTFCLSTESRNTILEVYEMFLDNGEVPINARTRRTCI